MALFGRLQHGQGRDGHRGARPGASGRSRAGGPRGSALTGTEASRDGTCSRRRRCLRRPTLPPSATRADGRGFNSSGCGEGPVCLLLRVRHSAGGGRVPQRAYFVDGVSPPSRVETFDFEPPSFLHLNVLVLQRGDRTRLARAEGRGPPARLHRDTRSPSGFTTTMDGSRICHSGSRRWSFRADLAPPPPRNPRRHRVLGHPQGRRLSAPSAPREPALRPARLGDFERNPMSYVE